MVWFKVDDSFYSSRKVVRIPRAKRHSAIGLWLIAGTWCANNMTDGRIEQHELEELGGRKADADTLIGCGLWERIDGGYQFHNWAQYQPTKADIVAGREKEAERKRKRRADGGDPDSGSGPAGLRADKTRSPGGRNPESGHPVPSRPNPDPTRTANDVRSGPVGDRGGADVDGGVESVEALCAQQAERIYGVDFGKVRSTVAKATDTIPSAPGVLRIIAQIIDRAHKPIPSPTGLVITSIRNDWAEWQQFLHEEGLAS